MYWIYLLRSEWGKWIIMRMTLKQLCSQIPATYYSRKASNWILEDSYPDYMLKAEECLKREKDRVSHYLHSSSEPKLLEKVQHELLSVYATQLLEKEHFGCHALLGDDKVEDLSRMYIQ